MTKRRPLATWQVWDDLIQQDTPNPLEVLQAAAKYERYLYAVEERAVRAARSSGHTWEEIAEVLGTSRQGAWQRWRRFCISPEELEVMMDDDADVMFAWPEMRMVRKARKQSGDE